MTDKDTIPQVFWDNFRWATEHSTELHQQYEDVFTSLTDDFVLRWVAIANNHVIASGLNPVRLREIAARKTGLRTEEIVVEFIESAGAIYGYS